MESKKYLIVTSDGPGTLLEGKDVLHRSIARFVSVFPDIKVIIVLPSAAISAWREYCMLHNFNHPQTVVPAGFTAFHSIRKALEKVPSGSLVAIHDGARPLVSEALVRRLFTLCRERDAGIVPVVPADGSVKRIPEGGAPEDVCLGERLSVAQLPQAFPSDAIREAYGQPYDTTFTDPASVAAAHKKPLFAIAGERYNIRVTDPEDLAVARALLKESTGGNK